MNDLSMDEKSTTIADDTKTTFRLKGSLFTLTVIQLLHLDVALFAQQLKETVARAPKFFKFAPVVLDLSQLNTQTDFSTLDFGQLITLFREQALIPVGVRGATVEQQLKANLAGLAILMDDKEKSEKNIVTPLKTMPSKQKEAPLQLIPSTTKIVTMPVRSGQQVYAKNSDLIVLSSVSHGAEVLADGHIHIYGPLRGRALAGINGNTSARIFCRSLEAELISVAGHYQMSESEHWPKPEKPVQIYLDNQRLYVVELV